MIFSEKIGFFDIFLCTETPQELQQMLQELSDESRQMGLKMNITKTKVMDNRPPDNRPPDFSPPDNRPPDISPPNISCFEKG